MVSGGQERSTSRPALAAGNVRRRDRRRRWRRRAISAICYGLAVSWLAGASPSSVRAASGLPAAAAVIDDDEPQRPPQNDVPLTENGSIAQSLDRAGGDVDPHQEQKQYQKWAFIPHSPPWSGENKADSYTIDPAAAFPGPGATEESSLDPSAEENEDVPEEATSPFSSTDQGPTDGTSASADATVSSDAGADVVDDRTLLDLFAESAKVYLTTQLIPMSDLECRWDWRSFNCEPACYCDLQFRWGDYHAGRSCRRRQRATDDGDDDQNCETGGPVSVLDQPVPRRLLSLVGQTGQILAQKATRAALRIKVLRNLRHDVCDELWEALLSMECAHEDGESAPPPEWTLPERLLCGPPVRRDGDCRTGRHRAPDE